MQLLFQYRLLGKNRVDLVVKVLNHNLGLEIDLVIILRAAAMLLSHIGYAEKSERLNRALDETSSRLVCNGTKEGVTAEEYGNAVLGAL